MPFLLINYFEFGKLSLTAFTLILIGFTIFVLMTLNNFILNTRETDRLLSIFVLKILSKNITCFDNWSNLVKTFQVVDSGLVHRKSGLNSLNQLLVAIKDKKENSGHLLRAKNSSDHLVYGIQK